MMTGFGWSARLAALLALFAVLLASPQQPREVVVHPDRDAGRPVSAIARPLPETGGYRITVNGWTRTIVRGGQETIDRCRAVLWAGPAPGEEGTTWLAGHDYCGFHRWDGGLPVGSRFSVTAPDGRLLRYLVTGHAFVARHSGSATGLIRGDLTLQTCRGRGTSFTYARQVA